MKWTDEQPTRPGFYWLRLEGGTVEVVQVAPQHVGGDALWVWHVADDVPHTLKEYEFDEWAGPIPEPQS